MKLRLFIGNRNYSSWSLRAWLALEQSGLEHEISVIALDREDSEARLRAAGPSARVPVLHAGELVIWDSLAIAEYLAERSPDAGLWPRAATARARARAVAAEMHAGFETLRARLPMDMRARHPQPAGDVALQADIDRVVAIWTDCRSHYGRSGDYLFGDWCLADAMYAPVVSRFRTYAVSLPGACAEYCEAVWNWPAMAEWLAAAEVEPWVIDLGPVSGR